MLPHDFYSGLVIIHSAQLASLKFYVAFSAGTSTPSFGQSAAAGPIPFGSPGTPVQGFNAVPFGRSLILFLGVTDKVCFHSAERLKGFTGLLPVERLQWKSIYSVWQLGLDLT